jgi:hypothetical protein
MTTDLSGLILIFEPTDFNKNMTSKLLCLRGRRFYEVLIPYHQIYNQVEINDKFKEIVLTSILPNGRFGCYCQIGGLNIKIFNNRFPFFVYVKRL